MLCLIHITDFIFKEKIIFILKNLKYQINKVYLNLF